MGALPSLATCQGEASHKPHPLPHHLVGPNLGRLPLHLEGPNLKPHLHLEALNLDQVEDHHSLTTYLEAPSRSPHLLHHPLEELSLKHHCPRPHLEGLSLGQSQPLHPHLVQPILDQVEVHHSLTTCREEASLRPHHHHLHLVELNQRAHPHLEGPSLKLLHLHLVARNLDLQGVLHFWITCPEATSKHPNLHLKGASLNQVGFHHFLVI